MTRSDDLVAPPAGARDGRPAHRLSGPDSIRRMGLIERKRNVPSPSKRISPVSRKLRSSAKESWASTVAGSAEPASVAASTPGATAVSRPPSRCE